MKFHRAINLYSLPVLVMLGASLAAGCGGGDGGSGGSGSGSGGGVAVSDTRTDGGKMSALDQEAANYLSSRIAEHWLQGPDGWTTEFEILNPFGEPLPGIPDLQFHQYREINFSIAPEDLTEAQKLNGSDYRCVATFEKAPERYYRNQPTFEGPQGWSNWEDAGLLFKTIAIERRNGKWICEGDDLFNFKKPASGSVPGS